MSPDGIGMLAELRTGSGAAPAQSVEGAMRQDAERAVRAIQAHQLSDAGMRCWREGRDATAISLLRRAMALAPELHHAAANLGIVLWHLGDVEEAGNLLRHAVALAPPEDPGPHNNLGVFYSALGDHVSADVHLLEAQRLSPGHPGPVWDRAIGLLERGDWEPGWRDYELRVAMHEDRRHYPRFRCPLWRGEDLDGKTLYVQGEQGAGDRIMFARYLAAVKHRFPGCKILFCVFDELINLFWNYKAVCDELLPVGVPFPDGVDYAVFLGSLPGLCGARPDQIMPDPGYLRARILRRHRTAPAALPRPNLPSLKIGVIWTGNPGQTRNRERSVPLELLLPLAEDPRVTLYGFQVGEAQGDIDVLGCRDLINPLGALLSAEGWVGTGLALLQLDLLISVCTGPVHLAGALDVPTLLLLHRHADWRWGEQGDTTAWYPSLRLLRQETHGDWTPVIAAVRHRLTALADQRFGRI